MSESKKNPPQDKPSTLKSFSTRHIGLGNNERDQMLQEIGFSNYDDFIKKVVPKDILNTDPLRLNEGISEEKALKELKHIASQNSLHHSFIGQGYYNTLTPTVILRNVFENPGWYTSYTPYQPEISQGRLEALINFQTMVSDLTGLDISNASLLDEATAAAEAMTLAKRVSKSKSNNFFVDEMCFPQTIKVMQTRAKPLDINLIIGPSASCKKEDYFGAIFQYPNAEGEINSFSEEIGFSKKKDAIVILATDLLALCLLKSPGELKADIAIGSSQRFGVPMGYGGPHAAFMSVKEEFKRLLPGRLVGASIAQKGKVAYRLALQTREQHIRREKATSNICTAQALLAIMAGFYGVYHGPEGIKNIANEVNKHTIQLAKSLEEKGFKVRTKHFFDTIAIYSGENTDSLLEAASQKGINLRKINKNYIGISLDESVDEQVLKNILSVFSIKPVKEPKEETSSIPKNLLRTSKYLQHPVFNSYRTETEMLRYIKRLYEKDIALDRAMIPLGSCTMKLNSTSEMLPVSWPEFSSIHPFAPENQTKGYKQLIDELEEQLINITGYSKVSLQPNAGSQGEYAGLLAIDAFHRSRGDNDRNICLIPMSAHGTNPASAQMVGMKIIPINCDKEGNIDLTDLELYRYRYVDDFKFDIFVEFLKENNFSFVLGLRNIAFEDNPSTEWTDKLKEILKSNDIDYDEYIVQAWPSPISEFDVPDNVFILRYSYDDYSHIDKFAAHNFLFKDFMTNSEWKKYYKDIVLRYGESEKYKEKTRVIVLCSDIENLILHESFDK